MVNSQIILQIILFFLTYFLIHEYNRKKHVTEKQLQLIRSALDYYLAAMTYITKKILSDVSDDKNVERAREEVNTKQIMMESYLLAYYNNDIYHSKFFPIVKRFLDTFQRIFTTEIRDEAAIFNIRMDLTTERQKLIALIKSQRFYKYYIF